MVSFQKQMHDDFKHLMNSVTPLIKKNNSGAIRYSGKASILSIDENTRSKCDVVLTHNNVTIKNATILIPIDDQIVIKHLAVGDIVEVSYIGEGEDCKVHKIIYNGTNVLKDPKLEKKTKINMSTLTW